MPSGRFSRRSPNLDLPPLILDYSPAPPPEEGPPLSRNAIRDPAYLPAQIGGIVGAYAFSLLLVACLLLALSKSRREHLRNRDNPPENPVIAFNPFPQPFLLQSEEEYQRELEKFQTEQAQLELLEQQIEQSKKLTLQTDLPRNFSFPSNVPPLSPSKSGFLHPPLSPTRSLVTSTSPTSTILAAGIDLSVDQSVVHRDRAMAQQQLEEMYKHVLEFEQAKLEGREYTVPIPTPAKTKKEKNKPSSLNLSRDEKGHSRGSSILSFLKSPRKNKTSMGSLNISSPIMTPMSGTFPRHEEQEMNPMPPRHYYAPPAFPTVPAEPPRRPSAAGASSAAASQHIPTPDDSPVSDQSIDARLEAANIQARESRETRETQDAHPLRRATPGLAAEHSREQSVASTPADHEPVSAVSERSTTGLLAASVSPTWSADLPASAPPSSNASNNGDSRAEGSKSSSKPTAVREGGMLPLRAYEPSAASPTAPSYATKQTVFTRTGPLSPGLLSGVPRTPWTGAPVPYTPYQPFSPVVPITPTVVTRADRKRMKKLEPKTPTVEMVKSQEEIWGC
ncbi:uncharacterized protein CTHT_0041160 [Thermochaetoides thermophila DSM 1495]|uniref:Uncharacterized protein n=1 Tax=Chaetomium thermophilum (strain DSM 1495 / CBS 144.50 / IMI 039719) TaxID=759272 RepID=G0SA65_CHATD|nr:hypothetical protein CTHT_0041160 [Thermochaetoides thermophila DSM 1495]EGS19637.1 hypothetical protein CTHT_0041160 [Thermochaetoides thermophila DSM 1495]